MKHLTEFIKESYPDELFNTINYEHFPRPSVYPYKIFVTKNLLKLQSLSYRKVSS